MSRETETEKVKTWTVRHGSTWFVSESLGIVCDTMGDEHAVGSTWSLEATEHTRAELDAMPDFGGF